jgi:hypothetical protein
MLTTFLLLSSLPLYGIAWFGILKSGISCNRVHPENQTEPILQPRDAEEFRARYRDGLRF